MVTLMINLDALTMYSDAELECLFSLPHVLAHPRLLVWVGRWDERYELALTAALISHPE